MRKIFIFTIALNLSHLFAQSTPNDGTWSKAYEVLQNTPEAEVMIRVGDIDNLGFGWEENFDPFCGKMTNTHDFPWNPQAGELAGMDRILLSTSFHAKPENAPCGADGYSNAQDQDTRPKALKMKLEALKNTNITSANLLLFVDDFQATGLCSQFKVWLNGTRFIQMERVLNHLDQTGPVGKMVNVKFPDYLLPILKSSELSIFIDDSTTYAGDGYAIDFAKLLINPKMNVMCKGNVKGVVMIRDTDTPIPNATIEIPGFGSVKSNSTGNFSLMNLPAGINVADVTAKGYRPGMHTFDVAKDETSENNTVYLDIAQKVNYNGQEVEEGKSLVLNNIQFDLAKATLTVEGQQELDKLVQFMTENGGCIIELSGHTSSDGTVAGNQTLSEQRVIACKKYLANKGIESSRISTIGYGQDKPIVPNDTPANRAKNRRVELKIVKM